jgi:hypothetical protein
MFSHGNICAGLAAGKRNVSNTCEQCGCGIAPEAVIAGRMLGWTDGQTCGSMNGWMDGRTDGRTDGRKDGWMDGWMDRWIREK